MTLIKHTCFDNRDMHIKPIVLTLCLFLVACSPVIAQEKKGRKVDKQRVDAKDLPTCNRKLTYKTVEGKSFQLHLFEAGPNATGTDLPSNDNRPAIVFFFGGGWNSGDPKQFYSQCRALADLGMVAMSAEYRVASRDQSKVIDCISDAQDAIAFVRNHAAELKIDPNRIAAGGGSAGGHLAAAVATLDYRGKQSDMSKADYRPNALVLFNPALILAPTGSKLDHDSERMGNLAERIGDKPESASPFHHLSKDLPPTILFHGKADTTVPYSTVKLFQDKATMLGCDCRLLGYEGEGHGFFNQGRPKYFETRDAMIAFLSELSYCPSVYRPSVKK